MGRPQLQRTRRAADLGGRENLQGKGRKIGRYTSETPLPHTSAEIGWQELSPVCVFVCFKPSNPTITSFKLSTKTAVT